MPETLQKLTNESGEWVYRPIDEAELAQRESDSAAYDLDFGSIRGDRNGLLNASDWTQLGDVTLDDDTAEEWQTYRQALRDLPATYSRVSEVVWPTPPE